FAGERSPGWRPEARAAVAGLSLATGAAEITRARLEAVASRLAEIYDRLRPLAAADHVVAGSGGALGHSRAWGQIITDALGVPIALGRDSEASTRGAALLVLEALGQPLSPAPAPALVLGPDAVRAARHRAARPRRRDLPGTGAPGPASHASTTTLSGIGTPERIGLAATMRIAIGCDDTGFPLKEPLVAALEADGHDVLDLGTFSTAPVDYPDYARAVGQAVLRGFVDASLLLCGSGAGGAIAANKMRGIRAALCPDAAAARTSREEADANVLCLAAPGLDAKDVIEIAQVCIATQYEPSEQQARQVTKIGQLEAGLLGADKAPMKPGATATTDVKPPAKPATSKAAVKPAARREGAAATHPRARAPGRRAPPPAVVNPPPVLPDPLKLPAVEETLRFLESREFLDRLWVKDATLWKGDAATVRNRLGWLTSPTIMRGHSEDIRGFADEVRRLQYSHVVLLGMGGPSPTGAVFNETFGSKMGFPDMLVLDSTDPGAVKQVADGVNLSRALFVVS